MTMNERLNPPNEGPVPHIDLGGYVLGGLSPEEVATFEADLARNPALRSEAEDLADLPRLLALAALVDDEDDDVVPAPAQRVRTLTPKAAPKRQRPLWAAAAAVLLAVGAGAGFLASRQGTASADRQVAFALVEPANIPTATGSADLFRKPVGVGVRLKMSGLTPNEPGSRYECWWVGKNGRVSAGSFQVGPSGEADVVLNVAGSLDGPFKININRVVGTTESKVLTAEVV